MTDELSLSSSKDWWEASGKVEDRGFFEAYLQNGELVHLLTLACWDHILQGVEFLIHLGSPSPLDQAVCCFPCNLSARCTCRTGLFLLGIGVVGRGLARLLGLCHRGGRFRRTGVLGLHLDDFPSPRRRWWEIELIQCPLGTSLARGIGDPAH